MNALYLLISLLLFLLSQVITRTISTPVIEGEVGHISRLASQVGVGKKEGELGAHSLTTVVFRCLNDSGQEPSLLLT